MLHELQFFPLLLLLLIFLLFLFLSSYSIYLSLQYQLNHITTLFILSFSSLYKSLDGHLIIFLEPCACIRLSPLNPISLSISLVPACCFPSLSLSWYCLSLSLSLGTVSQLKEFSAWIHTSFHHVRDHKTSDMFSWFDTLIYQVMYTRMMVSSTGSSKERVRIKVRKRGYE